MKKAIVVFSGGIDSVCTCAYLKSNYELYGISFSYGQRANQEIKIAKKFAKLLKLQEHKIVNIDFMKNLYGNTNVLTDSKKKLPSKFDYSIVVPIRNAVFLSIAAAWGFSKNASMIAFGAHTDDKNYPDCRPAFSKKAEATFNQGEIDGIKLKIRNPIKIWSPFQKGFSKGDLIKIGFDLIGNDIFRTWSCYTNGRVHCGKCESCNNRKSAFLKLSIKDKTQYQY